MKIMTKKQAKLPGALLGTEDAVETTGGLAGLLAYVNEVASPEDWQTQRDNVGFTLNAIGHEVERGRRGVCKLYDICRHRVARNGG